MIKLGKHNWGDNREKSSSGKDSKKIVIFSDSVSLPSLVGACYFHLPDGRFIFVHDDLLCYGTCSVAEGHSVRGELMEKVL